MSTCADDLSHAPAQAAGSEWRPLAYMSYEELAAGAFVETRPTAPISYRVDVGKGGIAGDRPQRPAGMAPLGGDVCVRGGPDGVVTEGFLRSQTWCSPRKHGTSCRSTARCSMERCDCPEWTSIAARRFSCGSWTG